MEPQVYPDSVEQVFVLPSPDKECCMQEVVVAVGKTKHRDVGLLAVEMVDRLQTQFLGMDFRASQTLEVVAVLVGKKLVEAQKVALVGLES
jgi:predicted SpoU family rRNA methylase